MSAFVGTIRSAFDAVSKALKIRAPENIVSNLRNKTIPNESPDETGNYPWRAVCHQRLVARLIPETANYDLFFLQVINSRPPTFLSNKRYAVKHKERISFVLNRPGRLKLVGRSSSYMHGKAALFSQNDVQAIIQDFNRRIAIKSHQSPADNPRRPVISFHPAGTKESDEVAGTLLPSRPEKKASVVRYFRWGILNRQGQQPEFNGLT
jgi:hypothetical protein